MRPTLGMTHRLLLIAGLQTAVLVGLVVWRQAMLMIGTPVVLETAPIDPRSLFQGDFVNLAYPISRLDPATLAGDDDFARRTAAYVVLVPGHPAWRATAVTHAWPAPDLVPPGAVVLHGRVLYAGQACDDTGCRGDVRVDYGIEHYFVAEGTGKDLEDRQGTTALQVELAVMPDGSAAIAALRIDGVPVGREGLF